jgi:hypothetical protein
MHTTNSWHTTIQQQLLLHLVLLLVSMTDTVQ